jgi:hypothetical protein
MPSVLGKVAPVPVSTRVLMIITVVLLVAVVAAAIAAWADHPPAAADPGGDSLGVGWLS